jgi:hypothetical protein
MNGREPFKARRVTCAVPTVLQILISDQNDNTRHYFRISRWFENELVVWIPGYRSRFDSRRYQIFWEVVSLERGPLSLVSITEELLEWKN